MRLERLTNTNVLKQTLANQIQTTQLLFYYKLHIFSIESKTHK